MRLRATLLPAFVLLALAAPAAASEPYPELVRLRYKLSSKPGCTLCHSTEVGRKNTVTTPFGDNLESRGARGADQSSLVAALDRVALEGDDSDGDEVADYQELRQGTDPNNGEDATPPPEGSGGAGDGFSLGEIEDLPPLPEHGCALRMPSQDTGSISLVSALLVFAALVRRRAR